MTLFKKLTALLLAAVLLLPGLIPARAAQVDTAALTRQLVNYFHYYQEDAALDYELILEQIRSQDPALADTWAGILDFWADLNSDMDIHSDVLPDGLPEDDSLCIVVMGYQLESTGKLRAELIDRLTVTLASARKYPNAYILCTGGGTASKNKNVTEAGQMRKWLVQNGIDSSRIIVEDDALSTIQNAIYGSRLLYRDYPQVRCLAVITSDYHIWRSCLYFHTQAALDAYKDNTEPMKVIANATCRINPDVLPDLNRQVEGVGMLAGLDDVERMSQPWLTHLDHIQVSGATEYAPGTELTLQVTAVYSNGYTRDVTAKSQYTGYDFGKTGFQTVTVSYHEGLAQQTADFDVYVHPSDVVPLPTEEKAPVADTEAPQQEEPQENEPNVSTALIIGAVCLALLAVLLAVKAKQSQKRRRRRRRPMNLS